MAKSCKCKEEECECPEWIFTFADLVMLMMGFFVILWVLKPAPGKTGEDLAADEAWLNIVAKIRQAFDYLPDPDSKDPVDQFMLLQKLNKLKPHLGQGQGGQTLIPRDGAQGTDDQTTKIRPGKHAGVGTHIVFAAGQAKLSPEAVKNLDQIVGLIKGWRTVALVKGHTALDDFPEGIDAQQKMDLSLRRAQAVADYLVAHGVEPEVLRVQGCSTFEPINGRAYTAEARLLNRRVEVEMTDTPVDELRAQAQTAPARPTPATQPAGEPERTAAVQAHP